MTDESRTPPVESKKDFGKPPAGIVKRWLAEIDLYERQFKEYDKRVDGIVKRYRDERETESTKKKMNILWSNVETLKPAVYARPPNPDVQRRFKDKDPVGKASGEVLERCLSYHVDSYDFDNTLRMCRDDYLLGGRGTAWVRYDPVISQGTSQGGAGQDYEEVTSEHVACDYVYWKDFGHTPARTWDEVDAVWRKVYLTRDRLVERFGAKGKEVSLDTKPEAMSKEEANKHGETFKTACVYEIWDKRDRKAYWIARGYTKGALDTRDDPLRLERFFPCPRPLYGNLTTGTLVPLPDFAQYQDQANEIDDLTDRITSLTTALRAVGWYPADKKGEIQPIQKAADGELVPVTNWALFADKGLDKMIVWYPVEQVATVVQTLYEIRAGLKQDLYEITGISDIVRGQGEKEETATAQQIKGQYAGMRLKDRQAEMSRFARDLLRIKAEIIAEQFAPETLAMMSGQQYPMTEQERLAPMLQWQQQVAMMQMQQAQPMGGDTPAPAGMGAGAEGSAPQPPPQPEIPEASWEAIVTLLRDDRLRSYRIDIETDSTIALDEQLEKEQANEFLGAVTPYLQGMAEAIQVAPPLIELQGQMLMAVTRRHKMGRSLEETFERTIEQLKQIASQPRPDPEQQKLQAEQQQGQQELRLEQAKAEQQIKLKQAEVQANIQLEQMKFQAEQARENAKFQHEQQLAQQQMGLEREKAQFDSEMKRDELGMEYDFKTIEAENNLAVEAMKEGGEGKPKFSGPIQRMREMQEQSQASQATLQEQLAAQTQAMNNMAQAFVQLAQSMQAIAMTPKQISVQRDASGRLVGGMATPVGNA